MTELEYQRTVREQLDKYGKLYNIPNLCLSDLYSLKDNWIDSFPNAECCGCYLVYDANMQLLYIGKVSLNHTLGRRLASYFRSENGIGMPVENHTWSSPPAYLQTIKVDNPWEAPSLEEFLLEKLQPPDNTRKRHAPTD